MYVDDTGCVKLSAVKDKIKITIYKGTQIQLILRLTADICIQEQPVQYVHGLTCTYCTFCKVMSAQVSA